MDFSARSIIMMPTAKRSGKVARVFSGGMNDYDANGKKIGHTEPSFFGGVKHYDKNGHKVGTSRPNFFGGVDHYDEKGKKRDIAIRHSGAV